MKIHCILSRLALLFVIGRDVASSQLKDDGFQSSILQQSHAVFTSGGLEGAESTNYGRRLQSSTPITLPFRMNCGNTVGSFTDAATGKTWVQDRYFTGNQTWNGCPEAVRRKITIANHLCQTRNALTVTYEIPVPLQGNYKVTLYFVEAFFSSNGKRVFNVSAENVNLITNLDPHLVGGGILKAVVRTFTVNVVDGFLSLRGSRILNSATISAIEIESAAVSPTAPVPAPRVPVPIVAPVATAPTPRAPVPVVAPAPRAPVPIVAPVPAPKAPAPAPAAPVPKTPTPALSTVRINSGATAIYTAPNGVQWSADKNFNGGTTFARCPVTIENSNIDDVYCSERNWPDVSGSNGTYTIPMLPGSYVVRLHFTELVFKGSSKRLFNVYSQNRLLRSNFDIFDVAGGRNMSTTITTISSVSSADPNVRLTFQNVLQSAKVSGIEILPNDGTITLAPTPRPTQRPTPIPFKDILINCGYNQVYSDSLARVWSPDSFYVGGLAVSNVRPVANTVDDLLYQYDRAGDTFTYEIPVPVGAFVVNLMFSENEFTAAGQRLFDITVEGEVLKNMDIFQMAGAAFTATRMQFLRLVEDDFLTIQFTKSAQFPNAGIPKVSSIEVLLDKPHIAHSVATGPYEGTVTDPVTNKARVQLTGQTSHTHGDGLNLVSYSWKEGNTVLGTSVNTNYSFGVGPHTISLTIADNDGNTDTEITTVTIKKFGFPAIISLSPSSGNLTGGFPVVITGSGFNYTAAQTTVRFGTTVLTGSAITILSPTSIRVVAPPSGIAFPSAVTVQTPLGTSPSSDFEYIGFPIQWESGQILEYDRPTVGRFGPDGKLYVGTRKGRILKVTMNADFTAATNTIVSFVNPKNEEAILGMAFDPLDVKSDPDVYFTMNRFFHKGNMSSSGRTVEGKIRRATGPNLETIIDVITGLPCSDLDHGLNGLLFLDNGELLFASGSHTNGGIPGRLSSSGVLKENFLSAAVGIAYLSHPLFNGAIKWSAADDGNMISTGIDLFAQGLRNPFGLVLHTNGKVYGTDNGPNTNYGRMSKGCNGESIDDQKRDDEINLLEKGKYYGHPNFKRRSYFNDPRQCVWRGPEEPSSVDYTAPLMTHQSSIDGIMEFHGNHFGGQLRYNLIYLRYNGIENIHRIALTPDGRAVLPALNKKGIKMNIGNLGLDLTQAPNGNLIEMRYGSSNVYYYKPIEPTTSALIAKTCWPHRGRTSGGTPLSIYGVNFNTNSPTVTVTVGGVNCPVTSTSATKVVCTLPGGVGTVDIVVKNGAATSTFEKGYRYISGILPAGFQIPVYK